MDFTKPFTMEDTFSINDDHGHIENDIILCAAIQMIEKPHVYLMNEYGSIMLYRHTGQARADAKIIAEKKGVSLRIIYMNLVNGGNGGDVICPCVSKNQECCKQERSGTITVTHQEPVKAITKTKPEKLN